MVFVVFLVLDLRPTRATQADETEGCDADMVVGALTVENAAAPPDPRRHEILRSALSCGDQLPPLMVALAALELAGYAYRDTGARVARTSESIAYLSRADREFLRAEKLDTWLTIRLALIQLHEELSELRSSAEPLEAGLALLDDLRDKRPESTHRFRVLDRTAWLEAARRQWRIPGSWERALNAVNAALALAPDPEELSERAGLMSLRGVLLRMGPTGRPAFHDEIQEAISAHELAIEQYQSLGDGKATVRERLNLAGTLIRSARDEAIERAMTILIEIVDLEARDRSVEAIAYDMIGDAHLLNVSGSHEGNATRAISAYRSALRVLPDGSDRERFAVTLDLALALSTSRTDREGRLREAVGLVRPLTADVQSTPQRARALQALAGVYLESAEYGLTDLETVRGALQDAAEFQDALEPDHRLELAGALAEYHHLHLQEDPAASKEHAVQAFEDALRMASAHRNWRTWAVLQNNLGNLYAGTKRPDLRAKARTAYEAALTIRTAAAFPAEHVDTITNLAMLDFREGKWEAAAQRYELVLANHARHFETLDPQDRRTAIHQSARRFESAAYSLARMGKVTEALAVVELGRARSIKARLGTVSGLPDVTTILAWEPVPPPDGTLVLVPVVTLHGTVVFGLVERDGAADTDVLFLDDLNGESVADRVGGTGGWLDLYSQGVASLETDAQPSDRPLAPMADAISGVQSWLGPQFVQPILDWAIGRFGRQPASIVFSPQGELAILPLHLAETTDGKYLIDRYVVSYTPSLSLHARHPVGGPGQRPKLTVLASASSAATLPVASLEARVVADAWSGPVALHVPTELAASDLTAAIDSRGIVHFVGHGKYDARDPLQSYLVTSRDRRLSVADMHSASRRPGTALVVLSACETGIVGVEYATNEYEGLAGTFLGLGARGVVASLWPVNDYSTMLIMWRFYKSLDGGSGPAAALRSAQIWLSLATAQNLVQVLDAHFMVRAYADPAARRAMGRFRHYLTEHKGQRVFSRPFFWAGLFFTAGASA